MKKYIVILTLLFWICEDLQAQEYNFQYCYNLNSTVQEALIQTLQSESERNAINEVLEVNLTLTEVNSLRALNPSQVLDTEICTYVYDSFDQDGWYNMENTYYKYNFISDNFFFSVIIVRPKSINDPDSLHMANYISLVHLGSFDPQLGFQTSSSILTPLYFDSDLELP